MQIGMIGLGRMGANMARRLLKSGHQCVVFDRSPKAVTELTEEKAIGSSSLAEFVRKLTKPRAVWLMVPAAVVDKTIADLLPHLEAEDILIDTLTISGVPRNSRRRESTTWTSERAVVSGDWSEVTA